MSISDLKVVVVKEEVNPEQYAEILKKADADVLLKRENGLSVLISYVSAYVLSMRATFPKNKLRNPNFGGDRNWSNLYLAVSLEDAVDLLGLEEKYTLVDYIP
jgi:hypothetical protein